jgi:hypothetical protein
MDFSKPRSSSAAWAASSADAKRILKSIYGDIRSASVNAIMADPHACADRSTLPGERSIPGAMRQGGRHRRRSKRDQLARRESRETLHIGDRGDAGEDILGSKDRRVPQFPGICD